MENIDIVERHTIRNITKDSETLQPIVNVLVDLLSREIPKKRAQGLIMKSIKQK